MTDAITNPAMEMKENLNDHTMEVEFAECDCCGLMEECTAEYVERIRERHQGKWICGLCGEAVKDEIVRSDKLISAEEAITRHMAFRRASRSPPNPAVHLIAVIRQILGRSLEDSSRSLSSMPNCITLAVESPSHPELNDEKPP